jgi:hypothetical protein
VTNPAGSKQSVKPQAIDKVVQRAGVPSHKCIEVRLSVTFRLSTV